MSVEGKNVGTKTPSALNFLILVELTSGLPQKFQINVVRLS